jgi:hypothetical protein
VSKLFCCKGNTKAQSTIEQETKEKGAAKIVWNLAPFELYNSIELASTKLDHTR